MDNLAGYCVKCKGPRRITQAVAFTMKNGRLATRGKCQVCSTTMIKLGAKVPTSS